MNSDWKVLLIGGSSASGKSYLARQLSNYYKLPLTEIDDIRVALQQIVNRNTHPDLFFFVDNPNFSQLYEPEKLAQELLHVGKALWPALDTLISKHIINNEPVIFEGDGILPSLLANRDLSQVKSIFLYDDEKGLYEKDFNRNRNNEANNNSAKYAKFSYMYGMELKSQAIKNNFTVIKSSPIETLFERTLELL